MALSIHTLNLADYFIIAIILISTLISLMRGFLSEAISLLTWIIAVFVAFKSANSIGQLFAHFIHKPSLQFIVGFLVAFFIILIIGSLINHFLSAFIYATGLSGTNRLLGMLFGFARGVLLIAIFILFAKMTSAIKQPWWQTSLLIPYFQGLTNWLQQFLPLQFSHVSHYFVNPKLGNS